MITFAVWQVGYCGLDRRHAGDDDSLDIMTYCKGYVAWDYMSLFIQVGLLCCSDPASLVEPHPTSCHFLQSEESLFPGFRTCGIHRELFVSSCFLW